MSKLIEICVCCRRVIRDDRARFHDMTVAHYHWKPAKGELAIPHKDGGHYTVHATICAEHLPNVNFKMAQIVDTPEEYLRFDDAGNIVSLNATLPTSASHWKPYIDEMYDATVYLLKQGGAN